MPPARIPRPCAAVRCCTAFPAPSQIVQTREPAALHFLEDAVGSRRHVLTLGGESMFDTGHEIFHRNTGGGIACVSCHVEGGEDGRVWRFEDIGDRRTQSLSVGLEGTAPFHWDGDMLDLGTLVVAIWGQDGQDIGRIRTVWYCFALRSRLESGDNPAEQTSRTAREPEEVECKRFESQTASLAPAVSQQRRRPYSYAYDLAASATKRGEQHREQSKEESACV